jgi:hypothetical protein
VETSAATAVHSVSVHTCCERKSTVTITVTTVITTIIITTTVTVTVIGVVIIAIAATVTPSSGRVQVFVR